MSDGVSENKDRYYSFKPVEYSPLSKEKVNQQGHEDYNSYIRNKNKYKNIGNALSGADDAPFIGIFEDTKRIYVGNYDKNGDPVNFDEYNVSTDEDSPAGLVVEKSNWKSVDGNSRFQNVLYDTTVEAFNSYLENPDSITAINWDTEASLVEYFNFEDSFEDSDNAVKDMISDIMSANKVSPDFQEYLDSEGAVEGSEIAQCQEKFNEANKTYREALAERTNITSGNDPDLKAEKAKAQERRDTYYALLDKKKDEIGTLADDIKFVDKEADESMEKIQEYDSAIVETVIQCDDTWSQMKDVEAEQKGIENKLNSITSEITKLESSIENQNIQLDTIAEQIDSTDDETQKSKLENQRNNITAQINKLEEQKKALEAEQEQWQKQKDEADQKRDNLAQVVNILNERVDELNEQRQIENDNYTKIQNEQNSLQKELEQKITDWTKEEQKIVSEYYDNINKYKNLYDSKLKTAIEKCNATMAESDSAKEALTEAKADAYEKFLVWKEQKRVEEERRAQEEAAAAAQATGTVDAGAPAGSTGATATPDATTSTSTSAPAVESSNATTTSAAPVSPQQVQSTQQLNSAKQTAEDALNYSTTSLNNVYDGSTNKLRSITSNKTVAYDGFIAKLDKIDSGAASAINAKKSELSDVEKDYGNVRKDIVQTEIAISSKDISLSVANAELESLIDARGILSAVKTEGLNDEQKKSLANLKKNADKAIHKKEAEIEKLNNLDSNLKVLESKRDELRARRDDLRADLKSMMSYAAEVHSSDAPELASYSGAYDKAVNDYDREEEAELNTANSSFKESVGSNKTALESTKESDIENAKKVGDKYKFDPNVKVELDKDDEEVT